MTITDTLLARTTEDGDCAVWLDSCASTNHPCVRHEGRSRLVRRLIWADRRGTLPANRLVRMTCTTHKCVNPDHMSLTTRKALAKQLGAAGVMSGAVRSAAIAKTKRATCGKLTDADVHHIRTSDEPGLRIAKRLGVSQSLVSKVRLGHVRREFSSPWAQLLIPRTESTDTRSPRGSA